MDRNKFYRIREELHRHPELSGQEKHTIQYIRQVLQEFQPSRIHPLEKGHGLVAEYSFPGEGPTYYSEPISMLWPLQKNHLFPIVRKIRE